MQSQELLARATLYSLIARGFAYPDAELRQTIADGSFAASVTEALGAGPGSERLLSLASNLRAATQEVATEPAVLEGEHTYLFLRNVASPPNESSYGGNKTFGGVREMAEAASFYGAFGLKVSAEAKELPDHVCVELEFMAALCAKEAYALEKGWPDKASICTEARARFVGNHLGRWLPAFASRVKDHGRLQLYPALAALAEACIALEPAEAGTPSAN